MLSEKSVKKFVFNTMLLDDDFDQLETRGIHVGRAPKTATVVRVFDGDFSPRLIGEAENMAEVFKAFYCIENAARELITDRLAERYKANWWNEKVAKTIRDKVTSLKAKEAKDTYHVARSTTDIGYTLFGALSKIIVANWDDFSDLFPDQHWVSSRFNDLEKSRNIIMHTGVLPQDEIDRVEQISRDWIRQVG